MTPDSAIDAAIPPLTVTPAGKVWTTVISRPEALAPVFSTFVEMTMGVPAAISPPVPLVETARSTSTALFKTLNESRSINNHESNEESPPSATPNFRVLITPGLTGAVHDNRRVKPSGAILNGVGAGSKSPKSLSTKSAALSVLLTELIDTSSPSAVKE